MAANAKEVAKQGSMSERARTIVQRLQREADDRVSRRQDIEQRWLADLRQYHGKYDAKIDKELAEAGKSRININQTRPKTNAMEARLWDMLFPTDDRNWGIGPTPVPDLTVQAKQLARAAADAKAASVQNPNNPQAANLAVQAARRSELVQSTLEVARQRAEAMQEEIDDALRECQYAIHARDAIRDACKIGTGVIKGPITDGSSRRSWKRSTEPGKENVYELTHAPDEKPVYWRVDPWNFFPESDAASMDECESTYERHLYNKKQLRRLANLKGFDSNAIRRLLTDGPKNSAPSYLTDLRTITGGGSLVGKENRYHVWEFRGSLTTDEIEELAVHLGQDEYLADVPEADPLREMEVVVWFCQGEPIKFGLHNLDSEDSLYSVFNLERDEASLFGFGVPYIMRDGASSLGAAWRAVMDNMGLASGPQVVINQAVIEPQNGVWTLEPRKIWLRKSTATRDMKPFEVFEIPSIIDDLLKVIDVSRRNIDEETALPLMAQGDQGADVTKTFKGMALLMNSVNIVFRRIVKNWDDGVTTPSITRMYDWLMQFSPKDSIKGDYKVDARGTSVLLVREMQSQNLMLFIQNFSGHPLLGKYLKENGLPALRKLAQTLLISTNELIKSDTEIAEDEAEEAGRPGPPNPEMAKIAAQMNLEKMRGENALDVEKVRRETQMMELAQQSNVSLDKIQAMLQAKREEHQSKERIQAVEAAVEQRTVRAQAKQPAKGKKKAPGGSGGYFSANA
jgi:hypothetical protein